MEIKEITLLAAISLAPVKAEGLIEMLFDSNLISETIAS